MSSLEPASSVCGALRPVFIRKLVSGYLPQWPATFLNQRVQTFPMKTKLLPFLLVIVPFAFAAEKVVGGPKGGRLLETSPQRAEFIVTKDRKAEIVFYDGTLKTVAPAAQVVMITAEPKGGRVKVDLEKTATGFISKAPLPASAEPYRVVVQIRERPDAAPKNFRVDLNLEMCGGCDRAEYACTCDDGGEHRGDPKKKA